MSPADLETVGTDVLVPGTLALWAALVVRAPAALRSPPRRRMLIALASLATSITIALDPVAGLLERAFRLGTSCGIVTNVWGVISSALILDFVLAATSRRRPLLVYGAAAVAGTTLVLLTTGAATTGCVTPGDVPWFGLFWWLLCLAHVLGTAPAAVLCARYAQRATTRPLCAGLSMLTAGFASSTVFWGVVAPAYLVTRSPWLGAAFSLNAGLTAWIMAIGVALPQLLRMHRAACDRRTARRLEPVWRQLVASVPHVHLPESGHWASDLRLYRRIIEIRDAILVLAGYAGADTIEAARAHVRGRPGAEALAAACWLPLAQAAKARGEAPRATAAPASESGTEWADEVAFALTLAEHWDSPLVRAFRQEPQRQR
ncbi:MAB_1171c family putative transporter [Amycolatopsis viridis]|uniref:AcrR family transcriptional regulator n=1 Tax=Amycolatopsis viridis TaxID=185678 RepID=A0ABX0SSB1_9PSEU|nr:MAB_1171c family putative transporter [Amycolatopsis viridis]NIH79861.1 AcrR family transcriptional regulator [Amycolatopsis viridis]